MLEKLYRILILYLVQSPLEILIPYLYLLYQSKIDTNVKMYNSINLRDWILLILYYELERDDNYLCENKNARSLKNRRRYTNFVCKESDTKK